MISAPSELELLKARQQLTWASGDYGRIAWITVPVAEALVDAVELRPGAAVLDVATGTGHAALAAARRFCAVTGLDYVPDLLQTARARAQAEGLRIDFVEGDAEELPFDDDSFDFVLSAIGVMFTADHHRAARELLRVCRPGGDIGLASWTPDGFVGEILKIAGKYAPPPPAARPATRWGTEDFITELLGPEAASLTFEAASVRQRFLSAGHFADFFITHYGPTHKVAERLDEDELRNFRSDLLALAEGANVSTDETVAADWDYLIARAVTA
ncbi:class I SAM-dependent methyltransferase [Dactylosporangium sucinum]|uniref:Methyltransferase n=1 Tax=Dactylosporangium sucinum TaxID=1424081 RepID=A0A917WSX7_9ACTN|nr:class I SAM-dependent methyltransferase [Dactylosporangium sucinum]GGM26226.1 methyltransferase [Dactylosporangium sucinum]